MAIRLEIAFRQGNRIFLSNPACSCRKTRRKPWSPSRIHSAIATAIRQPFRPTRPKATIPRLISGAQPGPGPDQRPPHRQRRLRRLNGSGIGEPMLLAETQSQDAEPSFRARARNINKRIPVLSGCPCGRRLRRGDWDVVARSLSAPRGCCSRLRLNAEPREISLRHTRACRFGRD